MWFLFLTITASLEVRNRARRDNVAVCNVGWVGGRTRTDRQMADGQRIRMSSAPLPPTFQTARLRPGGDPVPGRVAVSVF